MKVVSVNAPSSESDLTPLNAEQDWTTLMSDEPAPQVNEAVMKTPENRKKPLQKIMLMIALTCLLIELLPANRSAI